MGRRKVSPSICADCGGEIPINHRSIRRHFCKDCEKKRTRKSSQRFYYKKREEEKVIKTEKEKRICIYHDDLDGVTSAAIVRKVYPDCEFIPANHGEHVEEKIRGLRLDKLIVVDFSFNQDIINKIFIPTLARDNGDFCWIDHHKTAMEQNPSYWNSKDIKGIRSIEKAACELTWEYFFPNKDMPECIKLIGDMDMWKFKYGDRTKEFCEFANTVMTNPKKIDFQVIEPRIKRWLTYGRVLLDAKKHRIKKSFEEGQDATFEGYKCRVVNTNHDISTLGEYIYKDKNYPIAFIWSKRHEKFIVSLRSKTVDVGKLAKKHGGGGHKFASGFEVYNLSQDINLQID